MPTQRKSTTKTAKASAAPESLEESVVREEKRPPVTQVVEVVEEAGSVEDTARPSEAVAKSKTIEELMGERETDQETSIEEPQEQVATAPDIKEPSLVGREVSDNRKVVVDELFTQKTMPVKEQEVLPEISIHKKRGIRPVVIWAFVMILITVGISFIIITATGKSNMLPFIVPMSTPTPTPTSIPTPTPTLAELSKDAISIQVLNGGGVSGAALKMKTTLEEKGYTVADTGNTKEYSYEKTEILVKAESAAYLPQLEKDLSESYVIGTSAASLAKNAEYDVRVTVGKE
jgi:LytR cell envelope-related transcriptional attenuator